MGMIVVNPTEAISKVLAREQALYALKIGMRSANSKHPLEEDRAVSEEERLGAALLRLIIDRMDVFMFDDDVTLIRLVLPNDLLAALEIWGSSTADLECSADLEYIAPAEKMIA